MLDISTGWEDALPIPAGRDDSSPKTLAVSFGLESSRKVTDDGRHIKWNHLESIVRIGSSAAGATVQVTALENFASKELLERVPLYSGCSPKFLEAKGRFPR